MKKLLLTFCFCASAGLFLNSYAQCVSGYSSTGLYDDFSSTTEPGDANGGLYFSSATGSGGCSGYTATPSRTTNPGKLSIVAYQPYGCYVSSMITFGTTASGAQITMDLSADKTFSVDVTNPSSDTSTIVVRMALKDSLGHLIDTYANVEGNDCNNAYKNSIATKTGLYYGVAPGATVTLSGTYAGGYLADYSNTVPRAAGTTGANCRLNNELDFTLVSGIVLTVVNVKQNEPDYYNPWAVGNGTEPLFILDNLRVGTCPTSSSAKAAQTIAVSKLYPNPVSDMARVELNLKAASAVKVTLSDLMGKEVMTIEEGTFSTLTKEFSVAGLNKGIYSVNYTINGEAAKADMLMVK